MRELITLYDEVLVIGLVEVLIVKYICQRQNLR